MDANTKKRYDKAGPQVVKALEKRHFEAYYVSTAAEAVEKVVELIPKEHTVSWGGAATVDALGIKQRLAQEGIALIDRDTAQTPQERQEMLKKALTCGTFLMSSNAISADGQLVNIDGTGNRVAALCFGPDQVIVVAGMNKVAGDLEGAMRRAREVAAPVNAQRFAGLKTPCSVTGLCADCTGPDSICCQIVTTRICRPAGRIKVVLVGEELGFPTETVYGLGADALNETAVRHIFEAKGRPQDNPLIIHVPDASWLERYCREVPETAYRLAERFWPGPLTMILPRRENVPLQTTGGLETVGVRCPDHPVTRAIIEAAGVPVAAPSGNTSGRPSPTTAGHMAEDMDGKIDGIVDGGPCAVGVESTIIDLTVTPPRLLRPGGLPLEALEEVLGTVAVDKAVTGLLKDGEKPRAPGMKYRHYAPKAPVTAVTGDPAHSALVIRGLLREKAGVICFDEFAGYFEGHIVHRLGPFTDKLAQAQRVFDALRTFDGTDVTEIFAQCPDDAGLGLAVGNRLKKAAGFHLIDGDAPVVIGITGGTGSGKTSALQALEALGGTVLDCDAVYHQALREDETLRRRIRDAFGEVFRGTELDRQKLGSLVFSDPQALERLNGIIFDYLPGVLRRRMEGRVLVGLDAINLIESGLGELCCRTVAVLAPGEQRVQRIMQRDHIPEEYARLRIQAQKPDSYYREHCTDVLENQEETPEAFREKAEIFFRDLLRQLHHITEGGHEQ